MVMINSYSLMLESPLLYFKCSEGHFSPCKARTSQLVFCKPCNKLYKKTECEKFTDSLFSKKTYKTSKYEQFGSKKLYKFTASVRRNYHRYVKKQNDRTV